MSTLKSDKKGTLAIRELMAKCKKVKITINFNSDVFDEVKELVQKIGHPYQTLLNRLIKDSLLSKYAKESRLDKLEQDVRLLKKKISKCQFDN